MVIHILLIEDDPLTGFLYKRALERSGYQVSLTDSVNQGISSAKAHKPDLVLVDSWLPEGKTIDNIKNVAHLDNSKPVPCIVLAATNCNITPQDAFSAGASYYWQKTDLAPRSLPDKISTAFPV